MLFTKLTGALAFAGLAAAGPYRPVQQHHKPKPEPVKQHHSTSTNTAWATKYTATGTAAVAAAAATAKTSSPTSKVKGKAFDRVVYIYFENTDYDKAIGDPNFAWFAKKGITLNNYFAVTHPSEPNYMSSIAADYFGMENDDFNRADVNVTTIIDLLESRDISWAFYQEDMPYSGYEGYQYLNTENGANDYVRKHNPGVIVDAVARSEQRLSQIKNLSMIDEGKSMFHKDLKANKLPQWMFITPNMTSDGHDTDVTVAGAWCRKFLAPLLENKNFIDNTLVVITWDENETYTIQNNILGILLGDVIPKHLIGTTDSNFYNHYSEIATVEANWDLPTLGRWDVGANVYDVVAQKTGDKLRKFPEAAFERHFWNVSYAGVFNELGGNQLYPAPNLKLEKTFSGRKVYEPIVETWKGSKLESYYTDSIRVNDGLNPPKNYAPAS